MTSPFTCITCHVGFRDLEVQRQHYKSDWHRYNLKRKVAELPPITVEEFQKRVIAQRNKDDKQREGETPSCKICKKNFNTQNQYENHLSSKKHKEKSARHDSISEAVNEEAIGDGDPVPEESSSGSGKRSTDDMEADSDVESIDSDEWIEDTENPVKNNDCLFCSHHSRSLVRNLKHMTMAHSFFIPDPEYCVDIKGLLTYLGEKIFAGFLCIWCNDSGKQIQISVRKFL